MITAERQKVVEKEAETERKRAVIGNTYLRSQMEIPISVLILIPFLYLAVVMGI